MGPNLLPLVVQFMKVSGSFISNPDRVRYAEQGKSRQSLTGVMRDAVSPRNRRRA